MNPTEVEQPLVTRREKAASGEAANRGAEIEAAWLPVLMYHRVVDEVTWPDPYHICISTADFSAHMAYLQRHGYQSISLDDAACAIRGEGKWTKPVAITFDDGYRDNLTHALPILKKYGMEATVMLVSDYLGGHSEWDRGKVAPAPLLTSDEVLELRDNGIRFGAHGATHVAMSEVGPAQARHELITSKAKIEQLLGTAVRTFAYPYGRSTATVERMTEEAGFAAAFGVERWTRSPFSYGRIDAARCRGDGLLWRLKVAGHYRKLRRHRLLRVLNRVTRRAYGRQAAE